MNGGAQQNKSKAMRGVKTNRGAKGEMKMKHLLQMNLQFFAEEGDPPQFSIDDFKAFAENNEEAQKFLQSQMQSVADKQLEAWKQNNLDKIKQDTIKDYEESKKNKTPEQKRIEELEKKVAAAEAERITANNKSFVAEQISGLEIDGDLKDSVAQFMLNNLVSSDTEFTQKAVEAFTSVLGTIGEKHAEAIKSMKMDKAYGNKQQSTGDSTDNSTVINPEAELQKGIESLLS